MLLLSAAADMTVQILERVTACAAMLQNEETTKNMLTLATGMAESLETYTTAISKIMDHLKVN